MLQVKVTGWKSQKYSGKDSHYGRSVGVSPCITTFIPQTENSHSFHPSKDLSPQDSDTQEKLPPEPRLDIAQTEQLPAVSRLQACSGWLWARSLLH